MSQPYKAQQDDVFQALWDRQDGACALCGERMLVNRFQVPHARIWAKRRATIDHIVPRSKDGSDEAHNLQLAHAICNKIKGNHF